MLMCNFVHKIRQIGFEYETKDAEVELEALHSETCFVS